jgi:metal-responsive CopG/Arc/MetJ family transcriptional regulator
MVKKLVLTAGGIHCRILCGGGQKVQKINITLPEELLREIDKTAKQEHISRSEFLRKAVKTYWEVRSAKRAEEERARNIKEAIEIQRRLRKKTGNWNGVAEIRKWREAH